MAFTIKDIDELKESLEQLIGKEGFKNLVERDVVGKIKPAIESFSGSWTLEELIEFRIFLESAVSSELERKEDIKKIKDRFLTERDSYFGRNRYARHSREEVTVTTPAVASLLRKFKDYRSISAVADELGMSHNSFCEAMIGNGTIRTEAVFIVNEYLRRSGQHITFDDVLPATRKYGLTDFRKLVSYYVAASNLSKKSLVNELECDLHLEHHIARKWIIESEDKQENIVPEHLFVWIAKLVQKSGGNIDDILEKSQENRAYVIKASQKISLLGCITSSALAYERFMQFVNNEYHASRYGISTFPNNGKEFNADGTYYLVRLFLESPRIVHLQSALSQIGFNLESKNVPLDKKQDRYQQAIEYLRAQKS